MFQIGVCGDDCSCCPRYVATQTGSLSEFEKVKELWVRLGFRNSAVPARDMVCFGCKSEKQCAYSELRACAREKGADNCGLCAAYPCKLIGAAFEKSEKLRSHAARVCTAEEMGTLKKTFFSKKQNLDQIRLETNKRERRFNA